MSISKMLAIGVSMAVTAGSALAADELPSFTDRVQQSQGIGQERGSNVAQEVVAGEPTAPNETGSFIARVEASQGINTSGPATLVASEATAIPGEATSFISRVVASQGVGLEGTGQGAAAGEPSSR
jgi:hypothetical protein